MLTPYLIETSAVCTVLTCGQPVYKHSKCLDHFNQFLELGKIIPSVRRYPSLEAHIATFVLTDYPDSGCWGWAGPRRPQDGSPHLKRMRSYLTARSASWRCWNRGRPPMKVITTCGNPDCIHPDHLRRKTARQPVREERDLLITPEAAEMIQRLYNERGLKARMIAGLYGISTSYVYKIARGGHSGLDPC